MLRLGSSGFGPATILESGHLGAQIWGSLASSGRSVAVGLIQVQGYSSTAAGAAFLPMILIMFVLSRWAGGLIGRYGAKPPLMIGPAIAAIGFVLFAVPGIGGSYWTTFFPAVAILGVGMAITVAPLTTAVMSAVDDRHAGVASGVNNAVSRVAGLLAIAAFGIVVATTFRSSLDERLTELDLPPAARAEIDARRDRLAAAEPPAELDAATAATVSRDIDEAFVRGFRVVMLIGAGLAIASALIAGLTIAGQSPSGTGPPTGRTVEERHGRSP